MFVFEKMQISPAIVSAFLTISSGGIAVLQILALLERKTRGNLSAEERQLVEQLLYELRMRFVEAGKPESRIIMP